MKPSQPHYCELCKGRGAIKGVYGYVRCPNISGTPQSRAIVRRLHSVGTQGYKSPFKDHNDNAA